MANIVLGGIIVSAIMLITGILVDNSFMMWFGCTNIWMSTFTSEILKKQKENKELLILFIKELTK